MAATLQGIFFYMSYPVYFDRELFLLRYFKFYYIICDLVCFSSPGILAPTSESDRIVDDLFKQFKAVQGNPEPSQV